MALLTTAFGIVLLLPALTLFLIPAIVGWLFRTVLASIGWSLKSKTKARKAVLQSAARLAEAQHTAAMPAGPEDEDWEKVDSSASDAASGKPALDETQWRGVIGFFHPFW